LQPWVGASTGGLMDMGSELLHCNISYGAAARAKYQQKG
jgi:hypothetical protein